MGVESTCILVRWIVEPETRPCPLDQLIVITAQVGDEYANTGRDVELHVVPLLRKHQIRYVQVTRHGHLEAEGSPFSTTPGCRSTFFWMAISSFRMSSD
jgi:hypothetical protein